MKNYSKKLWRAVLIASIIMFVITETLFSADSNRKQYRSRYNGGIMNNANNDKTIESLLKYFQKNRKNYYVNVRLGWLYYSRGKYSNAKYHYKNAIRLKSNAIEPRLGIYLVYAAQKNYHTAQKYCKSVIKLDEYNYYGNLYLTYCYINNTSYQDAADVAEKMLKRYPSDLTFLRQLKFLYEKMGEKKKLKLIKSKIKFLSLSSNYSSVTRSPSGVQRNTYNG